MSPIIKWIGGATAALVLVFGGASLASDIIVNDRLAGATMAMSEPAEPAPSLEEAIPVSASAIAGNGPVVMNTNLDTETPPSDALSEAGDQEGSEAKLEQASAPKNEAFVIKRVLPIEGPIKYGEWHWDDKGVPDGPIVMTVDLDARVLSVFKGGYEIGATAVLLGTQDHPTPLGVFPILQKKKDNISSIYNVPMPYTLRLTWDGIAIHASDVENGFASHGCVGTPKPFAAKLFALVDKGDKVIITRGKRIGMGDQIL